MRRSVGILLAICLLAGGLTACKDAPSTSETSESSVTTASGGETTAYSTSASDDSSVINDNNETVNNSNNSATKGSAGDMLTSGSPDDTSETEATTAQSVRTTRVTDPVSTSTQYNGVSGTNFVKLADRALVNTGNSDRFTKLFEKAARGEDIVIGAIGGSITAGVGASQQSTRYVERIGTWFRENFPCNVTVVNAGIGATTSFYGVHRAQKDLLQYNPDLVIVEFSVNDTDTNIMKNSYEMLVRNILTSASSPAVMLLCTMSEGGTNVQDFHVKCGEYYGLPVVSYRDALWPEVSYGRLKWSDITADTVHPNDNGHYALAVFCTEALRRIHEGTVAVDSSPYVLPSGTCYENEVHQTPLSFSNATILSADKLSVSTSGDVQLINFCGGNDKVWQIGENGVLSINISGYSNVAFRYAYWNKGDMGYGQVTIDDGMVAMDGGENAKIYDGFFGIYLPNNGTFSPDMLATGMDPSVTHKIKVSRIDMSGFYADGTTGQYFYLVDLLVSN